MSFYFAYGSNMNSQRVEKRKLPVVQAFSGTLRGYGLRFNKRSTIYPGAASANVVANESEVVQGVVYELVDKAAIQFMDPFEGYPIRYDRLLLPIAETNIGAAVNAWVYIANDDYIQEGLSPARWYLNHLLAGQSFLTPDYFQKLKSTRCLPDSSVEP